MKRKNVGFKDDLSSVDKDDGLLRQRKYCAALKNANITPSTPEVISRQASENIAVVGSRGAGVSTFIRRMMSPDLRGHDLSDEGSDGSVTRPKKGKKKHNINFINAKLYKCSDPSVPRPECYRCYPSSSKDTMEEEHLQYVMLKHVCFLNYPSHCNFVSCLLTGNTDLDGIILVVPSDEPFSHQTRLLLNAISKTEIDQLIILQNKVDNVGREQAMQNYEEIKNCIQTCGFSFAAKAPLVPISVIKDKNVDVVIDLICTYFTPRQRDYSLPARAFIHRSLDPNPESCSIEQLKGGLVGGQILQGVFRVGMKVEIRPGVLYKRSSKHQLIECFPMKTKIAEMFTEKNALEVAIPGGMFCCLTNMDPAICTRNKLHGQIMGKPGTLPEMWNELLLVMDLFKTTIRSDAQEGDCPAPIQASHRLLLNIGGFSSVGVVAEVSEEGIAFKAKSPVCCNVGDTVSISRMSPGKHGESSWNLIGMGTVVRGLSNCPVFSRKDGKPKTVSTRALAVKDRSKSTAV